jgi:hypothetical protein
VSRPVSTMRETRDLGSRFATLHGNFDIERGKERSKGRLYFQSVPYILFWSVLPSRVLVEERRVVGCFQRARAIHNWSAVRGG